MISNTDIKTALLTATGQAPADFGGGAREALAQLDALVRAEKGGLAPEFAHYLERRSYLKALAWIEAGQPIARSE